MDKHQLERECALLLAERDAKCAEAAMLREALGKADHAFEEIHDEWAEPSASADMGQIAAICLTASLAIEAALAASTDDWLERKIAEAVAEQYSLATRVRQALNAAEQDRDIALARAEKAEAERASEKETRVKYQDIVYAVCNVIDSIVGRNGGVGVLANKDEITVHLARIRAEAGKAALLEAAERMDTDDAANADYCASQLRDWAEETDHA